MQMTARRISFLIASTFAIIICGMIAFFLYQWNATRSRLSLLEKMGAELEIEEGRPLFQLPNHLFDLSRPPTLTSLMASDWNSEEEGDLLSIVDGLGGVERLYVGGSEFNDQSLNYCINIKKLQRLYLRGVGVRSISIDPSSSPESLQGFSISETPVDANSLSSLSKLPAIQLLELEDIAFLEDATWLCEIKKLRCISLWNSTGVHFVIRNIACDELEELNASNSDISDAEFIYLRRFLHLKVCRVGSARVSDSGISLLRNHPSIETLWLAHTDITDNSFAVIATLPALKKLNVRGTNVTPKGVGEFQEANAGVEVLSDFDTKE